MDDAYWNFCRWHYPAVERDEIISEDKDLIDLSLVSAFLRNCRDDWEPTIEVWLEEENWDGNGQRGDNLRRGARTTIWQAPVGQRRFR